MSTEETKYVSRVMEAEESSAKKVRSASARASHADMAMRATISECNGVQKQFTEAIKSLNRTCRRRYIELFSNTRESYDIPQVWLEEEESETAREQLKKMSRAHNASFSQK